MKIQTVSLLVLAVYVISAVGQGKLNIASAANAIYIYAVSSGIVFQLWYDIAPLNTHR